jgi:hypothetical protein
VTRARDAELDAGRHQRLFLARGLLEWLFLLSRRVLGLCLLASATMPGCGGQCGEQPAQVLCPGAPWTSPDPASIRLTPEQVTLRYARARARFLVGNRCVAVTPRNGESIRLLPGPAPRVFERTLQALDVGSDGVTVENRLPVRIEGDWIVAVGPNTGPRPAPERMRIRSWNDLHEIGGDSAPLVIDGSLFDCGSDSL